MTKKSPKKRGPSKKQRRNARHTQGRHEIERVDYQSLQNDVAHGVAGHLGVRCYPCAQASDTRIQFADNSGEYWQNLQLLWQEKCDLLQNTFDQAIAEHFPSHMAIGCTGCPTTFQMPVKPLPPAERAIKQNL